MRMNIAAEPLMERFLQYLLDHPERFARSQVPCCLQGLWEEALEQQSPAFDSTSPRTSFPMRVHSYSQLEHHPRSLSPWA